MATSSPSSPPALASPFPRIKSKHLPRPKMRKSRNGSRTKKTHPPPTPPSVSVEAIKRSLLYTPSPRRFKKLRLRRLERRLRKEEEMKKHETVGDGDVGIEGRVDRGDDGGGSGVLM